MFLWIWQLDQLVNRYGNINTLISRLKSLNINDICIKYHEGSSYVGGNVDFRAAFLKYVDNFKNEGFRVGTWGYNYFDYIQNEANIIIEALNNSDYYIFDPEDGVSGKVNASEQICSMVRNAHPMAVIGYSSFPIVSYHQDIPYSVFNKYCDFISPQVYWQEMQWPVNKCLDKMIQDHKTYGLNKPIYPSIQTYKCDLASYEAYKAYGFSNTGAWNFEEMDSIAEQFINAQSNGYISMKALQQELNNIINAGLIVDGIQGPLTTMAIKNFQGIMGLVQDGIAGPKTLGAIREIRSCPTDGVPYPHYEYATRWIQWRVGSSIDGIFGKDTAAKVSAWQNWCNITNGTSLAVDGIVGPQTWGAMFKY